MKRMQVDWGGKARWRSTLVCVFNCGHRGCISRTIELRSSECCFQGAVKRSRTRIDIRCLLSNAIFAIRLHPQTLFSFTVFFSRTSRPVFPSMLVPSHKRHLFPWHLLLCITLFLGGGGGTGQNWSSFVVVHPLFVYTKKQDVRRGSSMAAVFSRSHSVETVWCHGNSRGEDARVGTVLDGLLCTALALLYLNHLADLWRRGDARLQQCSRQMPSLRCCHSAGCSMQRSVKSLRHASAL